ncbi:MAG: aminomethyl-transferring glycine dehydrogenase subunit GcvPA [Actinomycetota bacterium]
MDYTPHTELDVTEMLERIGAESVEALFEPIPSNLRLGRRLDISAPLSEIEVSELMGSMANENVATDRLVCFAGGGAYDHYIPAAVRALAYRSEFVTSYTPYQPELSQGVLGALFEYQTMICELTGMDVANASLYDGASALVEAVNLAASATGRKKIAVTDALNPNYREVLETFGVGLGYEFTSPSDLEGAACLIVAQPNFFGMIEDIASHADAAHAAGALLIVHYDLMTAGVLESPGKLGADIVTAEGQSLGNDLNFGGPYLGVFATRMEHVRRVPGRICGATVDVHGEPGFVLTLQAREQHIRREKANSNVCTNQTLMAVVATVYLSWLGPQGLRELGETCMLRSAQAAESLAGVAGCALKFDGPWFKEFVLQVPGDASDVVRAMGERGFLVGPVLADSPDCLLICVTERRTPDDIERLAKTLAEAIS